MTVLLGTTTALSAQAADTIGPPHRRHHALAYDPVGKRVLVYGGQHLVSNSEAPMLDDLWAFDGRRWSQVSPHTGIPMIAHKLFVDRAGGVFVTANAAGVTLRWDGRKWSPVADDSLTRREMAAGAFDSERAQFVLFGGHVGGRSFPRDTWAFDGRRWARIATSGPPPRLGAAMAYDSRRHRMMLFGGLDSTGKKLGDTWEFDGSRWTQIPGAGPPSRFGAGIAYDQARNEIVLFGGVNADNEKLNDTWRWRDGGWKRAESSTAPPPRSEGYLAYDEGRRVVVLFGGEGAQVVPSLGDTWEWDGSRWTRVN